MRFGRLCHCRTDTPHLLAWRDARLDRVELAYWRTPIGEAVDFVIEVGGTLLARSTPLLAQ
jgi:hypothetical protein